MSFFPVAADGRLFGQGPCMFRADPQDFAALGVCGGAPGTDELAAVGSSCSYADGRLFFRGNDAMYCFDVRRPNEEEMRRTLARRQARVAELASRLKSSDAAAADAALAELGTLGAAADTLLALDANANREIVEILEPAVRRKESAPARREAALVLARVGALAADPAVRKQAADAAVPVMEERVLLNVRPDEARAALNAIAVKPKSPSSPPEPDVPDIMEEP